MHIAVILDPEAVTAFADVLHFFQDNATPVRVTLFGICPPDTPSVCHPLESLEPGNYDLVLELRAPGSQGAPLPAGTAGKLLTGAAAQAMGQLLRELSVLLRDQEINQGILDTATDAIVTINEDHIIVGFNRGAELMFGYPREEALGSDLSIIIPPPHKEVHKEYVRRYLATRQPRFIGKHVRLNAQRRDGSEFPMSISFSVAEIRGNIYFTGIIRDISEYRLMEERLLRAERLAAVGNTVSHIAHEIKNPLAIIGGFARQLQKLPGLADKDRRKLDIIVEEVERLEHLIAQMRDYVRRPAPEKTPRDVEAFLDEVVALFEETFQEHLIRFHRVRGQDLPLISFDPRQLQQVLVNLFKNALEAMPQGGDLTLATRRAGPYVEISLKDTGKGIPPEVMANLFQPYFTTKEGGTGLGLAISQKIVQEHGGSLLAESVPGQGSTFTIQLPLSEDSTPE